jgi:cytochrome c oxidase assembly factor CtaG
VRSVDTFLTSWQFAPLAFGTLVATCLAYLLAARTVTRRNASQPWPTRYTLLFLSGLAACAVAVLGPFGALDDTFLWAHMAQHIVLMMLAAPLLLLGEPVLLVLRISSRQYRHDIVLPVLRSRVVRGVTNPVVTWILFACVLLGTHFTGFYEYALEHPAIHDFVEHPLYLGVGLLYFYPLLGVSPAAAAMQPFAKVVSLFLMMIPETVLGFTLYTAGGVLYPFYDTVVDRPFGPATALSDQRLAGAMMWSSGMLFNAVWISLAVWEWWNAEEARARRFDAASSAVG